MMVAMLKYGHQCAAPRFSKLNILERHQLKISFAKIQAISSLLSAEVSEKTVSA